MKRIRHNVLLFIFSLALFAIGVSAEAQQPKKIPRIGYVSGTGTASDQGPYVEALRQGMRDLGHVEGKTFILEYRGAEGNADRIPALISELVELKVDVLVAPIVAAILPAKQATKTIPIVMVAGVDPVATKLVDSLARPGGNLTGLSTLAQDLSGKRLELLKEVMPRLSKVAVLRDLDSRNSAIQFDEYQSSARALNLELQSLDVRGRNPDLETYFRLLPKDIMRRLLRLRTPTFMFNKGVSRI